MNTCAVKIIELFLVFFFGIRKNVRHLPDEQCILISNHNSSLDTYVLATLLSNKHRKSICVAAAKDTFAGGLLGRFAQWSLGVLLVDRHPAGSHDPLAEVKDVLRQGKSLIIYPEGTRGDPGRLVSFKRGIGVLSAEFPDVPVYSVFIKGVERCLAREEYLVVPFEIALNVGEQPLYGRDYFEDGDSVRDASKKIVHALETEVARLGGVERHDH